MSESISISATPTTIAESATLKAGQCQWPTWKSLLQRVRRELLTGFFLGLGAGTVLALTALIWLGQGRLALCLAGGVTAGVAGAAVLGLSLPILLRLLRLEPRVAAGPIALAGADILTILAYFNLARWLLG